MIRKVIEDDVSGETHSLNVFVVDIIKHRALVLLSHADLRFRGGKCRDRKPKPF
jgi:hypothetical protein